MAFTIKELAALSGIKAHTIRIWEQRYHFLKPGRTSTNIRMYTNEELKTLLTVSLLNKYGYKISHIDEMPDYQRVNAVLQLQLPEAKNERLFHELVGCMVDLKSNVFEELLNKHISNNGLFESIPLIFHFLEKVGLLWQSNKVNPAQEHIVTNIIRQKIISAIDLLPFPSQKSTLVLLFLPEYEHHELGLLIVHYLFKKRGISCLYLGANVPFKDVQYVVQEKKPDYLYTHLVAFPRQLNFDKFMQQLSTQADKCKIMVSGSVITDFPKRLPSNMFLLQSFPEVVSYISSI